MKFKHRIEPAAGFQRGKILITTSLEHQGKSFSCSQLAQDAIEETQCMAAAEKYLLGELGKQ